MAVSTSTEVSERELEELSMQLRSITENMRIFSRNIRSLYAENAVGSLSDTGVEFNKLRDDIRNDALVYVKEILPMSTRFVRMIRYVFGEYEAMKFEDWKECLDDTLEEVNGYKQFCEVSLSGQENVMMGLKTKEGQAHILVKRLERTSTEFEMKGKKTNETASLRSILAESSLSTGGPSAAAALHLHNQYERSLAIAYQEEAGLYGAASAVVSGTLIPALAAFLDAFRGISAFFSVLENSLKWFQDKGLDAEGKVDSAEENGKEARMKKHYQVMRNRAGGIKENCDKFFAVLPDIRTDLAAIPEEGTDTNYVQDWLKERHSKHTTEAQRPIAELVQSGTLALTY